MTCRWCLKVDSTLTRIQPRLCKFCGRSNWRKGKTQKVLIIKKLSVGDSMILPWPSKEYVHHDSNVIRCSIKTYEKRSGREFECTRHIAGLQVIRIK